MATPDLEKLNRGWNCRLTTVGRRSGEPRTVTIWYVLDDGVLYLTGGKEKPHWCRNLQANPQVSVEIAGRCLEGKARLVDEEQEARSIRDLFPRKYLLARFSRLFGGYTRSVPVVVTLDV